MNRRRRPARAKIRYGPSSDIIMKGGSMQYIRHTDEKIYMKGSGGVPVNIDLSHLEDNIRSLKDHKDTLIINLDSEHRKTFNNVQGAIRNIDDSPAHTCIADIIDRVFVDHTRVIPGTVGAYFVGCRIKTDYHTPGCAVRCAGSVPPTNREGYIPCEHKAILMDENRQFNVMNEIESPTAIIYIPFNCKWHGFTYEEIEALKRLGVKKSKIARYSNDVNSIQEETSDFNDIEMQHEKESNAGSSDSGSKSSGWGFIWIIILIIVIFAILGLVIYFARK
jgi:hypothetical protein